MQVLTKSLPKIAVQSIGAGLLLMALFTMMWTGIAYGNLAGANAITVLAVFACLSCVFIAYGIYFFIAARKFSPLISDEDRAEGKKMSIWYGIIFGAEGVTIPLVCGALIYFQQDRFIIPAIALVVGLHFYPMARVFKRSIDYYLATWTCLVAIAAIVFIQKNHSPQNIAIAFMSIGVATATSAYGLYMIHEGRRFVA